MAQSKHGTVHTEWHGVEPGTRVRILHEGKDWRGNRIVAVVREDGKRLPSPGGLTKHAVISPDFITYDAD